MKDRSDFYTIPFPPLRPRPYPYETLQVTKDEVAAQLRRLSIEAGVDELVASGELTIHDPRESGHVAPEGWER